MVEFGSPTVSKKKENFMPLKEGQELLIKRPGTLIGRVVRPRPGDFGVPEEQTHYLVQIEPRYFLRSHLEPVEEPTSGQRLERLSREWIEELGRFNEAGRQFFTDPQNESFFANWVESGTKLGLFIPIESEIK
jgi:hypothetical protein